MKKILAIMVTLLMIAFASPSFASVGTKVDSILRATTDINFTGTYGGAITHDGSAMTFNLLLAGLGNGGATSMATNDTAVDVSFSFIRKAIEPTDAAFQTGTLPDGKPGQMLTIYITERSSGEWVLTPATSTTFSTVTFDAVGEQVTFLFVDTTVGWIIWANEGATVALP